MSLHLRILAKRLAAVVATTTAAMALSVPPPATAAPIRTQTGWSVLLCKFSGVSAEPQNPTWFSRFFGAAGAGTGNLYDFFNDQSYGKVKLSVTVNGWYTMPYTVAQEASKSRWDKIGDCVATAAAAGYTVPAGNRIVAITNSAQDSGSAGGRVLLDPLAWNPRFAAHEMLHGYALGHSFSNDLTYQNASWSQPGEYDDMWDEMSAQHVYSVNGTWGQTGVGLNAYNRDKLGWIPQSRILRFGANGVAAQTVTLAPLQDPSKPGSLMARVPFDPGDLSHYYTVEYQSKSGWSAGIPTATVLIHEVRNGTPTLLRQLSVAGKPPTQSLSANGVTIHVVSTSASGATVRITSDVITRCVQGYVWREARVGDTVCVTGATRSQVAEDNAVKASRWVSGAYGPHTCVQGYVWRGAFSGDDVCVTGAQRTLAAADNAQAANRSNPARLAWGPNTCASGYVWRNADDSDYVCVTGATRSQVAADNAVKASRWVSGAYGPHTCVQGYVWRGAFSGDDVCVTGAQRTLAAADNAQSGNRLARADG